MAIDDLELFRLRWRIAVLEKLVLKTAFEAPLLARRLTAEESHRRLLGWLSGNKESIVRAYGDHLQDPAQVALYDGEIEEMTAAMTQTLDSLRDEWKRAFE